MTKEWKYLYIQKSCVKFFAMKDYVELSLPNMERAAVAYVPRKLIKSVYDAGNGYFLKLSYLDEMYFRGSEAVGNYYQEVLLRMSTVKKSLIHMHNHVAECIRLANEAEERRGMR